MQIRIFLANDKAETANLAGTDTEIVWAIFNRRGVRTTSRIWEKETSEVAPFIRRALDRLEAQGWRITDAPATRGLELVGR